MRHANNTARCGSHSLEKHNGFAWRWLYMILFLFQFVITPTIGNDSTENNCVEFIRGPIYLSKSDDTDNAGFGYSIANIGQINSAKATDVIVSIPFYGDDEGEFVILFMKQDLSGLDYHIILPDSFDMGPGATIGLSLANMGDLDNDGRNDIAFSSNWTTYGEVTFFKVNQNGVPQSYETIAAESLGISGLSVSSRFGRAIEAVGDWDGNGIVDLLVGAPGLDGGSLLLISIKLGDDGFVEHETSTTTKQMSCKTSIGSTTAHTDFGTSLAYNPTSNMVIVGAPGKTGGGTIWLLTLTSTLGVANAIELDTSDLSLSNGDRFGEAVTILTNSSAGADYDGDLDTLDIVVSAPAAMRDSDIRQGVLYIICLYPSTGKISSFYRLAELSNFVSTSLGSGDRVGQGLAALGITDDRYKSPVVMVGMSGFSASVLNGNRAGGILSVQLKDPPRPTAYPTSSVPTFSPTQSPTTSEPTPMPTISSQPTMVPTSVPIPAPSFQPSVSPAPTTEDTVTVGVSLNFFASSTPSDSNSEMLKTIVAKQLNISLSSIRGWTLTASTVRLRRNRNLLSTTWTASFDIVSTASSSGAATGAELGILVSSSLSSSAFADAVESGLDSSVSVDDSSIDIDVHTRNPSASPTASPSHAPTISFSPTHLPTLYPTAIPTATSSPSKKPTIMPSKLPSKSPSYLPVPAPTFLPSQIPSPPPTPKPTQYPSVQPTLRPTKETSPPTSSSEPTTLPSVTPTFLPTIKTVTITSAPSPKDTSAPSLSVSAIFLMTVIWCCVFAFVSLFFYTAQRYIFICCHKIYRWISVNILGRRPPVPLVAGVDLGDAIPTATYQRTSFYQRGVDHNERDDTCSICLLDMEPDEQVKELNCNHCYHDECIRQWLLVSTLCPLCKQRAMPPEQKQRRLSFNSKRVMNFSTNFRRQRFLEVEEDSHDADLDRSSENGTPTDGAEEEKESGDSIPSLTHHNPSNSSNSFVVELTSVARSRLRQNDDHNANRMRVDVPNLLRDAARVSPSSSPRVTISRSQVVPEENAIDTDRPVRPAVLDSAHSHDTNRGVEHFVRLQTALATMGLSSSTSDEREQATAQRPNIEGGERTPRTIHVRASRIQNSFEPAAQNGLLRGGRGGRGGRGRGRIILPSLQHHSA